MSYIPTLHRLINETSPERAQKARTALQSNTLDITLTFLSETEIRALLRNGDGLEYGLTLTEHGSYCSCKDAQYRAGVCKHAAMVSLACLDVLQTPTSLRCQDVEPIHLMWDDSSLVCGAAFTSTTRSWPRWTPNALNWGDLVCAACLHAWQHPVTAPLRLAA